MIRGLVNRHHEAVVSIAVGNGLRRLRKFDAVIDTGFNDWLSLPPSIVTNLRLKWFQRGQASLADGNVVSFDVYEAFVHWENRQRRIVVQELECVPLVGMALLRRHELRMQIWEGGKVSIRKSRKGL